MEAEEENRPFADAHRPARCSSPCGALKANLQAVRNHKVAPEIYRDSCRKARMILPLALRRASCPCPTRGLCGAVGNCAASERNAPRTQQYVQTRSFSKMIDVASAWEKQLSPGPLTPAHSPWEGSPPASKVDAEEAAGGSKQNRQKGGWTNVVSDGALVCHARTLRALAVREATKVRPGGRCLKGQRVAAPRGRPRSRCARHR